MAVLILSVPSKRKVAQDRAAKCCWDAKIGGSVEVIPIDVFAEAQCRDFFRVKLF